MKGDMDMKEKNRAEEWFPDPTGRRRGTKATSRRRETEHGTNAARIPRIFF